MITLTARKLPYSGAMVRVEVRLMHSDKDQFSTGLRGSDTELGCVVQYSTVASEPF